MINIDESVMVAKRIAVSMSESSIEQCMLVVIVRHQERPVAK